MQVTGKKRRRADDAGTGGLAAAGAGDRDRLSALPDCLLHEIMSHFKARQAVQTCALSTRWRHLWRSAPYLDLDQEEFMAGVSWQNYDKAWENFEDFIVHLVFGHDTGIAHLDALRLRVRAEHPRGEQAGRWIRHAIKYGGARGSAITRRKGSMKNTTTSWGLKRLHLCNVHLHDAFAKHVASRCLNLEDLVLEGCKCAVQEISSQSLKSLVLRNCSCSELSEIICPTLKRLVIDFRGSTSSYPRLVITAPGLADLFLFVYFKKFACNFSLNGMASLAKASIHLRAHNNVEKRSDGQLELLGSLAHVTSLHLSGFKTMEFPTFPHFKNLKTLSLDECDLSDNFKTLGHFLQDSPNLEKLTLRCCKFPRDLKRKEGIGELKERLKLVDVQCKNLKLTEIIYGDDDVSNLVKLLLSSSWNLPNNKIKLY
ncbi:hypothetical protein ACP70R_011649 [Stipagrostis hirtigluma subsp. patula]